MIGKYLAWGVVFAAASLVISEGAGAQTAFATFDSASEPVLNDPHDLAFGPDGNLYIADKFAGRIVVMDPDTLAVLGSFGEGRLSGVHDISFGPDGRAYIAVTGSSAVVVYGFDDGQPVPQGVMPGFARTEGALAHSNGRLYVMAGGTGQLIAIEGNRGVAMAPGFWGAHDVAEAPDGSIWVGDNNGRRLVQLDADLSVLGEISGADYGFLGPRYLDFDDFGRIIVADQESHRVLMIDPVSGDILGVIGDGLPGIGPNKLDDPEGVAVRGNTYFFSDSDNNRIVKYVVVIN